MTHRQQTIDAKIAQAKNVIRAALEEHMILILSILPKVIMQPHQTKLVLLVDIPRFFSYIQYRNSLQVSTIRTVRSNSRDRIRNMQSHRTTQYCGQSKCFVQIPVNKQVCFVWEIWAEIVSQFWTVVSYRTPSGTGTGTTTVIPWSPVVCREESTAMKAV